MDKSVRIDKWLWCVRLYKTRTLSAEACSGGKVTIDDVNVKPSRAVKVGDIIKVHQPPLWRTVKVVDILENRVGAKVVPQYMEDLTPQEEYDKVEFVRMMNMERRDPGTGRLTKKERREIDRLKDRY